MNGIKLAEYCKLGENVALDGQKVMLYANSGSAKYRLQLFRMMQGVSDFSKIQICEILQVVFLIFTFLSVWSNGYNHLLINDCNKHTVI